jgi:Ca2+-binding RTX toxin-like protein
VAEDTLRGFENLIGGGGNDDFTGDQFANVLVGGAGNDRLVGLQGKDTLDGGTGLDTASYAERTQPVIVALDGATEVPVSINGVDEDTLRNVENLIGGTANDRFTGDAG